MSRLRLVLVCVFAALAASVVGAASASALHWGVCLFKGVKAFLYSDRFCSSDNAKKEGEYELYLLPENVLLRVADLGVTKFVLKTKVSGITLEMTDEPKEILSLGWIENSLLANGELQGLDLDTITFHNMVIASPSGLGCTASLAPVKSRTLLVTEGGVIYNEYKEDPAGNPFAEITIANCTGGAAGLDGTYNVTGQIVGKVINAKSELEFAKGAPNNKFKFGSNACEITGSLEQFVEKTTQGIYAF